MTDTPIPDDVMKLARETVDAAEAECRRQSFLFGFPTAHGKETLDTAIARAILADREARAKRVEELERALRPFALTAASDEEVVAMQQEIAPGVMAVLFAAKLGEVMSARTLLAKEGSDA